MYFYFWQIGATEKFVKDKSTDKQTISVVSGFSFCTFY